MKQLAILLLVVPTLLVGGLALAEETRQSSRSAGKLKLNQDIDLSAELQQREAIVKSRSLEPENYTASPEARLFDGIANRHDQLFEIYSADARMISDLDGDGFHHALNVSFDVDVNYEDADVYAKLYLSRDGEPWSQYFTTDLFHIHGDSSADAYEVETELLEGYYTGYYTVLIEIYSLDHAYMVASQVLDYYYLGKDLMLEDLDRDRDFPDAHGEVSVSVGGGSFGSLLLFFLFVQVVIAARGRLALSPLQKASKVK